jgi:mannose-6-phosphate isomerase
MSSPFDELRAQLGAHGLTITDSVLDKPWGGYYRIEESQKELFITSFFRDFKAPTDNANLALTPKILMVAPGQRLSWQYHLGRGEAWHVLRGPVGVEHAMGDAEPKPEIVEVGSTVEVAASERHDFGR